MNALSVFGARVLVTEHSAQGFLAESVADPVADPVGWALEIWR